MNIKKQGSVYSINSKVENYTSGLILMAMRCYSVIGNTNESVTN
jgi:hypothetical protein